MFDLTPFQSIVFDCDGVILNSNTVKTEAFFETALTFGEKAAAALVNYHKEHGGVSRYKKFEYFVNHIIDIPPHEARQVYERLLSVFAVRVKEKLLRCELAEGLAELKEKYKNSNWFIVSGSDQAELRSVFAERNLLFLFDGGVYGSPTAKPEILSQLSQRGLLHRKSIFLGDSKYDFTAAKDANMDFIFVSEWTEFEGWDQFHPMDSCLKIRRLSDLL